MKIEDAINWSEAGGMVVVPNALRDAIHAKLDAAFAKLPEAERPKAEADRETLYSHLLAFFNQYGYLPEFSLAKADQWRPN